jgi:hypothetical protein
MWERKKRMMAPALWWHRHSFLFSIAERHSQEWLRHTTPK